MKFKIKDIVLAYHGPVMYKARIASVRKHSDAPYRVHYLGWSKNTNEWLPEDQVLELNPENEAFAKSLEEKLKDVKPIKKSRKGNNKPQQQDNSDEQSGPALEKTTLFFGIPDNLKEILLDDKDKILADGLLIRYQYTVHQIIEVYKSTVTDQFLYLNEYLDGLVAYFDHSLPLLLLYLFERPQFQQRKSLKPSKAYGLQHFLRLFTILPSLMPFAELNDGLKEEFQQFTEDLLIWLSKHHEYLGTYIKPEKSYIKALEDAGINL